MAGPRKITVNTPECDGALQTEAGNWAAAERSRRSGNEAHHLGIRRKRKGKLGATGIDDYASRSIAPRSREVAVTGRRRARRRSREPNLRVPCALTGDLGCGEDAETEHNDELRADGGGLKVPRTLQAIWLRLRACEAAGVIVVRYGDDCV